MGVPNGRNLNYTNSKISIDISDEINKLFPFKRFMVFTKDIIDKMDVPKDRRKYFETKYDEIMCRANDSELKLALLGQFSAGKSTFINALLRKNMLKTAWKATTAIPTFIRYGEKRVVVHLKYGGNVVITDDNTKELYDLLNVWGCSPKSSDFTELLQIVTTGREPLNYVDSVELFYPGEAIVNNLCLIDTPGVNPGEADTEEHRAITQRIIKERADAAVILFPATRVFTSEFAEFLMKNALSLMHRCAFVITMMDIIDEDERDEIVKYTYDMLKSKCSLSNPKVFYCAAEHVLNKKDNAESKYWQDEFYKMEKDLVKYIISERSYVIAEELTRLLEKLFEEMKQDLNKKQDFLKTERDNLNQNSISKLNDVLETLRAECEEKNVEEFNKQKKIIDRKGIDFEKNINNKIVNLLSKASYSTVENTISQTLPNEIKSLQNMYIYDVSKDLKEMIKSGEDVTERFGYEFERFYKNLKALDAFERVEMTKINLPEVKSISFTNFKSSTDKEHERDKKNAAVGAGSGGTIGFMLGGPIGALIGAGIGAITTVAYSGTKWDQYRDELEKSTKKDVSSFVAACKVNSIKALEIVNQNIWESVDNMIDKHRQAYEKTIEGMIKDYEIKLQYLKEKQIETNHIKSEIDEMLEELESIKMNIKNIE